MVAIHARDTRKGHYGRWPFSTLIPVKDHSDSICRLFPISKEESARNIWIRRLQSGQCLAGSASFFFRKWWSCVTTSTSLPPQLPPPSKAKQRRATSKMRRVFKKKRATKKRKATT